MPWMILGSATMLAFAMWAPMFSLPPMEHILKEELHLTHTQTGLLFIAPILMLAALAIPGGLIADRIGVRKAAGIGAIIIAVGTVLRGTASNPTTLLAFTFIYGIGLGLSLPNLPKLVSEWTPREKTVVITGIYTSGILAGAALPLAITMPLIFPITNTFQGVFFIWSIPTIGAAILWWVLVREPPRNVIDREPVTGWIKAFRRVLRNKNLWVVSSFFLLNNFFFYTWAGWAPALLRLKGATPDLAGLITSITLWVGIPSVFLMPRLAYKLGLRKPFLWAPGIALALALWGAIHSSLPMAWLLMVVLGVASNTRFVFTLALPVEMMSPEEVGTASGLLLALGHTGGVVGSLMGGRILDLTGNLDVVLLILSGISIAATGIAFSLPETGPRAKVKEAARNRL